MPGLFEVLLFNILHKRIRRSPGAALVMVNKDQEG